MNVSFQLGRLVFEFSRDVFTDAVHLVSAARTHLFFRFQVVVVWDLMQLVPVNLAILPAAMALNIGFGLLRNRLILVVRRR